MDVVVAGLSPVQEEKAKEGSTARHQGQAVVDIPNEFYCSITQEIMRDPVVAEDGHTYGKSVREGIA